MAYGDTPDCLYDTCHCQGDCCEEGERMWDAWRKEQERNAENEYEEEEMSENKDSLVDAKKVINSIFDAINEIDLLKDKLKQTEKRALDWEQMHLDQCELNKRLRKELDEANTVIRDQIERNQTSVGAVMQKKYEKTLAEERAHLREQQEEAARKCDEHNAHIRANIGKQTATMEAQTDLLERNSLMYLQKSEESIRLQAEGLELQKRGIAAAEQQNEILNNIVTCLGILTRQK